MRFLALAFAVLLSGCATLGPDQYVFVFESQPSGAMVYTANGTAVGVTPISKIATVPPETLVQDRVEAKFTVVWASGAKLQTTHVWNPKQYKRWRFTFDRPASIAGMDIDLRHANEQQAVRAQQERADAEASRAGYAALLSGMSQRRRSTSCFITRYGPDMASADCN